MQILRAEQHRAMRWKNGGGITYEIASFPPADQTLDGFDWRVSMALVETDGPFSVFPGIDRTLAIMDGAGLLLAIDDAPEFSITPGSEPHAFAADVPTSSRLIDGPVSDLNVMTRRGAWQHRVTRLDIAGSLTLDDAAEATMVVVRSGKVSISNNAARETLSMRDAAMLPPSPAVTLEGDGAEVFRVDMWRT